MPNLAHCKDNFIIDNYSGFLLPEKYILFERLNKILFSLWFWQYDKENVLKQCQSNGSTNHGERGVVLQTPKQMWLDGHQLIYEYLLAHEY